MKGCVHLDLELSSVRALDLWRCTGWARGSLGLDAVRKRKDQQRAADWPYRFPSALHLLPGASPPTYQFSLVCTSVVSTLKRQTLWLGECASLTHY